MDWKRSLTIAGEALALAGVFAAIYAWSIIGDALMAPLPM